MAGMCNARGEGSPQPTRRRLAVNRRLALVPPVLLALLAAMLTPAVAQEEVPAEGLPAFPEAVDPQSWVLPEWMTWDDYVAIPGVDWLDPSRQPPRKIRAALILGDFADRDFVVTMPEGSDIFARDGLTNPIGVGGIPREEVADFYLRHLITEPNELNNFHTVSDYWLEDSYGLIGVDGTAFGPYRMQSNEHEYGLGGGDAGGADGQCPSGDECGQDFDSELIEASFADVNAATATNGEDYDFRWLLHAAYDESGTWQEFGEMLFPDPDSVSEVLGNPDPEQPNWVETRYVDWTSFASGEGIWSHAIPGVYSTQGESDGSSVFAHELSHIFGVLDNYNNPYGNPVRRSYSGPWDMLSRGTFNGPGGPHTRWQIPATQGGSMGSHHMLRNKIRLGFLPPNEVTVVERDALAQSGPVFAEIWPRAYPLAPTTDDRGLHGVQIVLSGGDDSPPCTVAEDHRCAGGGYQNYTIEVVERIGHDSFTPDHGVLIAKTKNADTAPFIWVIDSHPDDLNDTSAPAPNEDREIYDFIRPGTGEQVPISLGDYRQLADALFHAGTGQGVLDEFIDEANRLHFYVLSRQQPDGQAVPTYRVAVRSLDGGGPFARGLEAAHVADGSARPGNVAVTFVSVTNSGNATDLFRLGATTDSGWSTHLAYDVIEIPAGETVEIPVYVSVPREAESAATVTLTATSETDPDRTASASAVVNPVGEPVPEPTEEPLPDPTDGPTDGPTDQPTNQPEPEVALTRVAGGNRIETAVEVSGAAYPEGSETVVLARSDAYPDALTGAPLAAARNGPMLLTDTGSLPEPTLGEIQRLRATRAILLGGIEAIGPEVAAELDEAGLEVERIAGETRFQTAVAIAAELGPETPSAYLAEGANPDPNRGFPDPLSAAPLAAYLGRPILLTNQSELPGATVAALDDLIVTETIIVGGPDAVSDDIVATLEAEGHGPRRLAGANRYETSVAVGNEGVTSGMAAARLWLATGLNWPDALTAGPAVAALGQTFLLVDGNDLNLSPATGEALADRSEVLRGITLVGGTSAISEDVAAQVRESVSPD